METRAYTFIKYYVAKPFLYLSLSLSLTLSFSLSLSRCLPVNPPSVLTLPAMVFVLLPVHWSPNPRPWPTWLPAGTVTPPLCQQLPHPRLHPPQHRAYLWCQKSAFIQTMCSLWTDKGSLILLWTFRTFWQQLADWSKLWRSRKVHVISSLIEGVMGNCGRLG